MESEIIVEQQPRPNSMQIDYYGILLHLRFFQPLEYISIFRK